MSAPLFGSVSRHKADAGKRVSGTGTRGGKMYMPHCSCGWKSPRNFFGDERDEAIAAMRQHLDEVSA